MNKKCNPSKKGFSHKSQKKSRTSKIAIYDEPTYSLYGEQGDEILGKLYNKQFQDCKI